MGKNCMIGRSLRLINWGYSWRVAKKVSSPSIRQSQAYKELIHVNCCPETSIYWKFAVDQQKEIFINPMMGIGVELLFDNVDPEWIKGCHQLYDDLALCTGGGLPKQ